MQRATFERKSVSRRRIASTGLAAAAALGLAATAAAQSTTTPFGGFRHDASQPIQVSSDTLQVRNEDQVAIFDGNVDVAQGAVRMSAQRLEVTYRGQRGQNDDAADAVAPGQGAIDRLKAIGDVLISNGEETAKADVADYDVAKGEIVMSGDVILVQDRNVIKGKRLRIDLASGTAKMDSGRVQVSLEPTQNN